MRETRWWTPPPPKCRRNATSTKSAEQITQVTVTTDKWSGKVKTDHAGASDDGEGHWPRRESDKERGERALHLCSVAVMTLINVNITSSILEFELLKP